MKILSTVFGKAGSFIRKPLNTAASSFEIGSELTETQYIKRVRKLVHRTKKLGLKRKIVRELEQDDMDTFLRKSLKIAARLENIPDELIPPIEFLSERRQDSRLATYNKAAHRITLEKNAFDQSRAGIFDTIIHEMRHARQYLDILRTKSVADQAIQLHIKVSEYIRLGILLNKYGNLTLSELEKKKGEILKAHWTLGETSYNFLRNYIQNKSHNIQTRAFVIKEHLKHYERPYLKQWYKDFREKVVALMGEIDEKSEDAAFARKYQENPVLKKSSNGFNITFCDLEAYNVGYEAEEQYLKKKSYTQYLIKQLKEFYKYNVGEPIKNLFDTKKM